MLVSPTTPEITPPELDNQPRFEVFEVAATRARDEIGMAYHGLRAAIANRRMGNAGETMEQMEHKEALYADLGALAATGTEIQSPTASGEPARPRTFIERRVDRRVHKRSQKKLIAENLAHTPSKVFGPHESLPGMNKRERKHAHSAIGWEFDEHGNAIKKPHMSAREKHNAKLAIDGEKLKHGEQMHKQTAKQATKTAEKLQKAVRRQSVWGALRQNRRQRAIGRIKTQHSRYESRIARREEIRDRRNPVYGPPVPGPEYGPPEPVEPPEYGPPEPTVPVTPVTPATTGPRVITHAKGDLFGGESSRQFDDSFFSRTATEIIDYEKLRNGNGRGRRNQRDDARPANRRPARRGFEDEPELTLDDIDPMYHGIYNMARIKKLDKEIAEEIVVRKDARLKGTGKSKLEQDKFYELQDEVRDDLVLAYLKEKAVELGLTGYSKEAIALLRQMLVQARKEREATAKAARRRR